MVRLFVLLFVINITFYYSQDVSKNYIILDKYRPDPVFLKKVCGGFDSLHKSGNYSERKEDKAMKLALEDIKKNIVSIDRDTLLMKNDPITTYLQKLVDKIQQKNPVLKQKVFNVFVYRTSVSNAANYGSGVIFFNLNLLAKFDNEENVAFILCHEIGHDLKGHVIDGIRKNYQLKNDPALKKQFDALKKQEFNKLKSYESYIANYMQKLTSHARSHEIEADSVGLQLYYNTGYDLSFAYETMNNLDSIDNDNYTTRIDYLKHFDFPSYPFKQSWLLPEEQDETLDGGNMQGVNYPDSLKTHPDCKKRLSLMKNIKFEYRKALLHTDEYKIIKDYSMFEMLDTYMEERELSMGLYNCLQMLNKYPDNLYLKCSVVNFMYEIYQAKINHYVSHVVDRIDKRQSTSYQEFLNFLNINSETTKSIIENYFKANFNSSISDPYAGYVFSLLKSIGKSKEQRFELVMEYEKNFGKNIYSNKLKSKFKP